jgi:UDP-N-acetylmuramate--alanine ligase
VFIDDYAHHPEELRAVLLSLKSMYPGQNITGIFQPHLYSRTRDFAEEFGKNLSLLDDLLLLDIYPAREDPIEGIDSAMLLGKVVIKNKTLIKKEELISGTALKNKNLQIVITLGAGDISTLVEPLRVTLLKQKG